MGWGQPGPRRSSPPVSIEALIEQAAAGEPYTIERGGRPVAVLLGFDQYQALRAAAEDLDAATAERSHGDL